MPDIHFVNVMPSIWLGYMTGGSPDDSMGNKLKKFCEVKKIRKMIRMDKDITSWAKSRDYINDIKKELLKQEIFTLVKYYNEKMQLILRNYYSSNETLFLIDNRIELLAGLFIIFYKKYADMQFKDGLVALQSKIYHTIDLSQEMQFLLRNIT